jgi:hypothetical protein
VPPLSAGSSIHEKYAAIVHVKRFFSSFLFLLLLPAIGGAQVLEDYDYENLELRGIGFEVGAIWPTQVEPTIGFGVRADLGLIGPNIRISPAIRYWSSSLRQVEVDRLADQIRRICERQANATCPSFDLGEIRRSDLEVSVDGHFLYDVGLPLVPYAGAGLGLHLLSGRGEAINDTFVQDLLNTLAPGLNIIGGVGMPLGEMLQLFTEARLVLVPDVQYVNLLIGGTWTLPSAPGNPFRSDRRVLR